MNTVTTVRKYGPRLPNNAFYSRNKRKRYTRTGRVYGSRRRARRYTEGRLSNARIGGLMGIERKYVDYHCPSTQIGSDEASGGFNAVIAGPAFVPLNGIAQGDGATNRDGRQVTLKSLQMRGHFIRHAAASTDEFTAFDAATIVRFVVVLDRQNNATATPPIWSQVFDTATVAAVNSQNWQTFRLLSNSKRYKVLVDKVYTLQDQVGVFDATNYIRASTTKTFNIYRKLPLTVNYTGVGETGAGIADNAIWVFALANNVGSALFTGDYVSRVRFCG